MRKYVSSYIRKVKFVLFFSFAIFTLFTIYTKTRLRIEKTQLENAGFNKYKSNHWSEIETIGVKPFPEIRLFCWVLTRKQNLHNRASYIRDTWARRCDRTLFFQSDKSNITFPTIGLNIKQRKESKNNNIVKTIRAWRYVYRNYGNDFDFFLKTDDDLYIIVENLKLFLADKNPDALEFYAHNTLLGMGEEPFDQAGTGLILTRRSLASLNREVIIEKPKCLLEDRYGDGEDWKTAFCLRFVAGAKGVNTLDSLGRDRIMVFRVGDLIADKVPGWFKDDYSNEYKNMIKKGDQCCGFYPFAFHEIKGTYHLMMDYIFYNIRVSGDQHLIDLGVYRETDNNIESKLKNFNKKPENSFGNSKHRHFLKKSEVQEKSNANDEDKSKWQKNPIKHLRTKHNDYLTTVDGNGGSTTTINN
ncbi:unnamed protein product [Gordionus sp. m RMFG-2023]|uniref:glycoprotein-N-acetylgalactosamine 3-beta-galactosyltransferase 1-like n=1 Tax=Gordionus sp. m RMFG-2023 TaxID=3053472 RepID=UPI0030DFBD4E